MRSYDLVNWEIVNYVFDTLEDSDKLALRNVENNYGKGQWATTLRYNDGVYYAGFTSFSTGKTYIYHTDDIENGKWDRFVFDECFHDMSLCSTTARCILSTAADRYGTLNWKRI